MLQGVDTYSLLAQEEGRGLREKLPLQSQWHAGLPRGSPWGLPCWIFITYADS